METITSGSHIVPLLVEELPIVLPYAKAFYLENHDREFQPSNFTYYWTKVIEQQAGKILVEKDGDEFRGGLGYIISYGGISTNDVTAIVLFWVVRPEYRTGSVGVRLLKAFEREACAQDVDILQISMPYGYQDMMKLFQYETEAIVYRKVFNSREECHGS